MVKGMTRRIVEIRQPENSYFEKAVFYCRTNLGKNATDATLMQEACKIIDRLCLDSNLKFGLLRRPKLWEVFKVLASVSAGALGAVVLLRFF